MESITKNIEAIRKEKGVKQAVIADLLGVTQSAYSQYMNRNKDIKYLKLVEIANKLEVSVIDVITYPIKYVPETAHCEDCRKKDETIENLNEYIKLITNKRKRK